MIMLGIHFTGQVPFRVVICTHWFVRVAARKCPSPKGRDLIRIAEQQYGTDAMRFCLASMAGAGTDIVLSDDRLSGARNFANKIWMRRFSVCKPGKV